MGEVFVRYKQKFSTVSILFLVKIFLKDKLNNN